MPCVKGTVTLPRWSGTKGWYGGRSNVLYAFRDKMTGKVVVRPGGGGKRRLLGAPGPNATVRVATRAEAEKHWQKPLHGGWNYACKRS